MTNISGILENFAEMSANDMLCVAAPSYTDPSRYELVRLPLPAVSTPTDVQIAIHAASINPIDVKKASGVFKVMMKDEYALLRQTFELC